MCYGRCFLVCGLNPGSQQELIHSIVKSVAESLKQALCPLTRDDCFHSPCSSLEVLKTFSLGVLKERYESVVWCHGGGKHLCVRVDEVFDDVYEDRTLAVCAVCVRYQSLRGECE